MKRSTLLQGATVAGLVILAAGATLAQPAAAPKAAAPAAAKAAPKAAPKAGTAAAPKAATPAAPVAHTLMGVNCDAPPAYHCPDEACEGGVVTQPGNTVEMKTRRVYFLDCPKDYKAGDKVTVLLSLHGFGSFANWERNYFPAFDVKDKYHLVIITPGSNTRSWAAEDDEFLHNAVDAVVGAVGKTNVDRFILAGHSQGGITANRLVCTPYFRDKVDVEISLSGGRVGPLIPANRGFGGAGGGDQRAIYQQDPENPPAARGGGRGAAPAGAPGVAAPGRGPAPAGAPAAGRGPAPAGAEAGAIGAALAGRGPAAAGPPGGDCDYSYIYSNGQYENEPGATSPIAEKFGCSARVRDPDVVDTKKGYVWDSTRQDPGSDGWGRYPRSGRAQVWTFPKCKDGRIVADVMKLGKGHTEGYEPNITDKIIAMATSAKGGKIKSDASYNPPAPPAQPALFGAPGAGRGPAPGAAAPARGGAAAAPARAGAAAPARAGTAPGR